MDFNQDVNICNEENTEEYTENLSYEIHEEYTESLEQAEVKRSFVIQKPILVAITAFVLTALIIFSSVFVYNITKKDEPHPIIGAWVFAENPDSGVYIIFDEDGYVYYSIGSVKYYGTYSVSTVEVEPTEKNEGYTYEALKSNFDMFSQAAADVELSFNEECDKMTIKLLTKTYEFIKVDMPELKLEPQKVTHASADELEATAFATDKDIIGTWKLDMDGSGTLYEYYTFNEDGTCLYRTDYIDYYKYGLNVEYKYTVKDGNLLFTYMRYDGTTVDEFVKYRIDNGKFVLSNNDVELAYERVE